MHVPRRAALLVALATLAAAAVWASSARAVIVQADGQTYSYQPLRNAVAPVAFDSAFDNLEYSGGPVMPSNRNYLIFWAPRLTSYPAEYVNGLKQYMTDLAHDSGLHTNTDSVSTQYGDSTGQVANYKSSFGGAILDQQPYPANKCPVAAPTTHCLDDAELQAELARLLAARGLPRDLSHEYFLLFPPHVENCFDNNPNDPNGPFGGCSAGEAANPVYCAYHSNSAVAPAFVYSNDPFVTGNVGCDDGNHPNGPSDGALEGGLSHEHNESITDPIPNSAWTELAQFTGEIGDKCAGSMGTPLGTAPDGAQFNQKINGHDYWYQEEWSNQTSSCLQRFTLSGTLPVAKFTSTAGSGTTLKFNAGGSSTGLSDFNWQFNDGPGLNFPIEQTTPAINHAFPSSGIWPVGLTVYKSDGTSGAAGGLVQTGHTGFVNGFTISPTSPVHGSAVMFHGIASLGGGPVTAYSWNFGDGGVASGVSPSHTYAAAGTFQIRLTMVFAGGLGAEVTMRTLHVS
jgi:PKD repeat protein